MAFRAALHQAGAAALTQLLRFPEPADEQRGIPCPCGQQARYRELRARRLLTALGEVELLRPWYLCPHCHHGQFPVDRQLDVENRDFSPGVRRMQARVGSAAPFDHGREQLKLLAGLEVTAKSVERTAEAIGFDIAAGEQREIRKAVQLDLPVIVGKPIPVLYVEMDGTGVPVVKKETEGRKGKTDGQPAHTRCRSRFDGRCLDTLCETRISTLFSRSQIRDRTNCGGCCGKKILWSDLCRISRWLFQKGR